MPQCLIFTSVFIKNWCCCISNEAFDPIAQISVEVWVWLYCVNCYCAFSSHSNMNKNFFFLLLIFFNNLIKQTLINFQIIFEISEKWFNFHPNPKRSSPPLCLEPFQPCPILCCICLRGRWRWCAEKGNTAAPREQKSSALCCCHKPLQLYSPYWL